MRGYYIVQSYSTNLQGSTGVSKKITRHINELKKYFDVEIIPLVTDISKKEKIRSRIPFTSIKRNYSKAIESMDVPDFVYIRRINVDRQYLSFLKEIKKRFPKCKIIIELFSYPYDVDEFLRNMKVFISKIPFYIRDVVYRGHLHKYVDRFVTYTRDDSVFKVKAINTINGFDVQSVDMCDITTQHNNGDINIISVAHMQAHHGYERIIKGLIEYYRNDNIQYKINYYVVGDGEETEKYKKMVQMNKLNDHVFFLGKLEGNSLDKVYNQCDIGVCSFGLYKYGIEFASSLKIPEYLAKGLPIISGSKISTLDGEEIPYCLEFDNSNTNVDMQKVVRFYELIYSSAKREEVVKSIHDYALLHFNESLSFKPIIRYIDPTIKL